MDNESEKKLENLMTQPPNKPIARCGLALFILAVICSALAVSTARATVVLDPDPEDSTTQFARAMADIGDVNGDGVPDLAVGAPFQDGDFDSTTMGFGEPQNVGKVWVLNGATRTIITQLNDPQFQLIQDDKFGGQEGWSLAPAGDINGDGIPDVIVGDPHHNVLGDGTGSFNVGRIFVFSGATDTVLLTLDNPIVDENARDGYSVVSLGDTNSDGIPDILAGAPGQHIGDESDGLLVGVVYLYSGADGSLLRTFNDPTQDVDARFGFAVANGGDIDRDGVADAIIGAPGKGEVFVFSGKTGTLLFTILSPTVEKTPSFGSAVAGGKDFDRDRIPDIVVGAPLFKGSEGAVYVFKGSDGTLLRKLRPTTAQLFSKFGAFVTVTDDLTGDRRPDIFVGAPEEDVGGLINAGEGFIFDGARGKLFQTLTSETPQAFAGFGSAFVAPDLAGTGTLTKMVGVPFQNADIIDPIDGDVVTHLQIGQIEIK
jgi:FG-GAP repeat